MDDGRTLWLPTTMIKITPFLALLHELICHITVMVIPSDCTILGSIENGVVDLSDAWLALLHELICHITVMVIPSDCTILGSIENGVVDL